MEVLNHIFKKKLTLWQNISPRGQTIKYGDIGLWLQSYRTFLNCSDMLLSDSTEITLIEY